KKVLSGAKIRHLIESHFGELMETPRNDPSQPAVDYSYADLNVRVGFINPVTEPFCGDCNRLRLTAEGQIRNCLFSNDEWNAKSILREGGSDENLIELIRACVGAKKAGQGT